MTRRRTTTTGSPGWDSRFKYLVKLDKKSPPFLAESVDYRAHVVTARGCFASTVSGWATCRDADGTIEAAEYQKYYGPVAEFSFPLGRVLHVKTLDES